MSATPLRRGHGRDYKPTSPQIQPLTRTRSCGACCNFVEARGGSTHRVLGWICQPCTDHKNTNRRTARPATP